MAKHSSEHKHSHRKLLNTLAVLSASEDKQNQFLPLWYLLRKDVDPLAFLFLTKQSSENDWLPYLLANSGKFKDSQLLLLHYFHSNQQPQQPKQFNAVEIRKTFAGYSPEVIAQYKDFFNSL